MKRKQSYAITALTVLVLLSGCAREPFRITPDVINYDQETLNKAADEIESGFCPVIGGIMIPDYQMTRDQSRIE